MRRSLLAFLILSACALFSKAREENLNKVQIGQSKAELVAILGEPSNKTSSGSSEHWFYDIISRDEKSSDPYTADFENGKLTKWFFDTSRTSQRSSGTSAKGRKSRGSPPGGAP